MGFTKCCGFGCWRIVFQIFQTIFLITGMAVFGLALWHYLNNYSYIVLLNSPGFKRMNYMFLLTGVLIILIAIIGFIAISKQHARLLYAYILLLVIVFLLEGLIGILSYIYHENLEEDISLNFNETLLYNYKYDDTQTAAVDYVQQELKCCGAGSYSDWRHSRWLQNDTVVNKVPDSCCKTVIFECGRRDHPSNIFYNGCMDPVANKIHHRLWLICGISLSFTLLHIFGIITAIVVFLKLQAEKIDANYSPTGNENLINDAAYS